MTVLTETCEETCQCLQCGCCCTTHPCALAPADLAGIAGFLRLSLVDLFRRFLVLDYVVAHGNKHYYACPARKAGGSGRITTWDWTFAESPCIFLQDNRCAIEQVKPRGGKAFSCQLMTVDGQPRLGYSKRRAAEDWSRTSILKYLLAMAEGDRL